MPGFAAPAALQGVGEEKWQYSLQQLQVVVTAMLYSGLGDKIHKLLGFKFCKFSPETA